MSTLNLSPLELVVSHNSKEEWTKSSRYNSQSSTGSDLERSQQTGFHSRRPWLPAASKLEDTDSQYHYYLGDIYARNKTPGDLVLSTQAEQEETAGRYHEHVRKICRGWHHLRYLADFMTVSTVPLRFKTITVDEREERLHRVNVTVVEYGSEITSKHLISPEQLDEYLSEPRNDEVGGRLLVLQDLSTCMIEKVGAAFDIEPGFFRTHIGDYVWLNTRDPQAEIPDLESLSRKSNYFHVQYVQPRYFETQESLDKAREETKSFNILRHIDHDERFKSWTDVPGSDVGLVRSKASLWIRPQKNDAEWLGVLLVDPTINYGFPLWAGYGNFLPSPSINTSEEEISFPPYHGTAVQEFVYWTMNQFRSKSSLPSPAADLLPLAFFTMICSQWIIMCEYVNTRLGQIEYEIELGLSHLYSHDFDHTVKALLKWRRRMPIYHAFVDRSISRISARFKSTEDNCQLDSWEDVRTNLRDIRHRLEILHCRADKIMTVTMAVTAREESKKATQESHAVTRVSYLAFVFVPLGFLCSFFSMSGDFPTRTYWIYATIALPVSLCAIGGLMFADRIGKWLRKMRSGPQKRLREENGARKSKGRVWND